MTISESDHCIEIIWLRDLPEPFVTDRRGVRILARSDPNAWATDNMNRMKSYLLWIGHAGDGRNLREISFHGIQAIVQLALEEAPLSAAPELIALRFPLIDGKGNEEELLHIAIRSVAVLIEKKIPALVCCGAGMSRSPVIVATALAILTRSELEECLKTVVASHPADISPGLLADVRRTLKGMLEESA